MKTVVTMADINQRDRTLSMRKPRVAIFNYGGSSEHNLKAILRNRGYEIFVLTRYANVTCPMSGMENTTCAFPVLCCDVMIVAEDTDQMRGIDLFYRQSQLGCKLAPFNKAIITSSFACDKLDNIIYRDTTIFANPFDFHAFEQWLKNCEGRIDLSQRLAVIRHEDRHDCSIPIQLRPQGEDAYVSAQAINKSHCGICLRVPKSIERGREIQVRSQHSGDVDEGVVQWVKKLEDGWYLSGVSFCV